MGDMDHDDDHHDMDHGHAKMANVHFLVTAMMGMVGYNLKYFRYRSDADYYASGLALGADTTNYWEMSNMLRLPASGLIFTQALSMAGIAVEVNMMAWMYLTKAWMLVNLVSNIISFVGYETAYSWYAEDTSSNATGGALMTIIGNEVYMYVAKMTATMMGLVFAHKAWMYGQWSMLDEETQAEWMEKKGHGKKHDDDHDDDDDMFSLRAFYGF